MVDTVECVKLTSYDWSLVMMLAEKAGCRQDLAAHHRPSLGNVPGYESLKRMRNEAQSRSLLETPAVTPVKKRKLFDYWSPSSCEKQPRHSRAEQHYLRSNPTMIQVDVDGHAIMMKKASDGS